MRCRFEAQVYFFTPAIIPGLGTSGGFEMVLEARGDATYDDLARAVDTLRYYAAESPEFAGLSTSMQSDIPQLFFDVDRDKAKLRGIPGLAADSGRVEHIEPADGARPGGVVGGAERCHRHHCLANMKAGRCPSR